MDYELPTEFDLIVVGTGIVESIISAAASRIGKTVLHIDSNDYYGGLSASFNLESIEKLYNTILNEKSNLCQDIKLDEGEIILPVGNNLFDLKNTSQKWIVPSKQENKIANAEEAVIDEKGDKGDNKETVDNTESIEEIWTQEKLLLESRKFNIDISPKIQFARGHFVELLISSNIARYSEYRSVSRVLTWLNGQLEVVPCSRSDVFSNTKVSVIEKRMLMKLLNACLDSEENEFKGYENKTFLAYLKDKKLTENLIHYVLYAIAMCTNDTLCLEGVENVKRFLTSLGRFGKTPFLYSLYGSGELSQAFCRLSAVFGGVYALNQKLNGFVLDVEKRFKGLICGKQLIKAQHVVMGADKSPAEFVKSVQPAYISRGIFITDGSIMKSEKEQLTLLFFPQKNGKRLCNAMELGSLTGTCPKNLYIVHMFTKQENSPKEDLEDCVSKLFQSEKEDSDIKDDRPRIMWCSYYSAPDINSVNLNEGLPDNIFLCPGPDVDLDIDLSIKKAKEIFDQIYPDSEFLPRAPDPEELIIGDEDTVNEDDAVDIVNQNLSSDHAETKESLNEGDHAENKEENLNDPCDHADNKEDNLNEVCENLNQMKI